MQPQKMAIFLLTFLCCSSSYAGYFELGLSGNYRKIYLPSDTKQEAFDETQALTMSLAYYFLEMTAIEFGLTKGNSERFIPGSTADVRTTYTYSLVGSDFIFTFAQRTEPFIPYVKVGVGYFIEKEVAYEYDTHSGAPQITTVPLRNTLVPSAGLGFRTRITNTLALKIGLEAWSSDALANRPKVDWAGKAGVSWFF